MKEVRFASESYVDNTAKTINDKITELDDKLLTETWIFTLEDGSTVTKEVVVK